MPQKDAPKKTSVSKLAKEKHVRIVKHFQPISYSKEHRNYELPEVDNDIDVQEYLNKVTNHQRFTYQERTPKNTKEIYTKNEKITKSTIITRKRNKRGILDNTEPSSKSQSLLENTNYTTEIPKQFLTRKSKSFSVNRKPSNQISRQIDKNKSKNILISSSSPNFNENYVTNLKREISQSRCKTADAWLDTKLYLMHKNEIHNEKVRHLREEISKLINIDLEERKKHVTELKTEIAEFKRNDYITVYNVETRTNTEIESENDVKTDETNKSSTTSVEEASKEEISDIEMVDMKAVAALREIEEETNEQEIRSTDLTVEDQVEENEKPTCEKLCLLEDKNAANAGLYSLNISDQEDFIKAKILEANMLIDRVKDTLSDIKNKSKRDNQDHDKYMTKVPAADAIISQIHYEPLCSEVLESARPKTRRPMSCQKKSDVEDKFKNTLCDNLEATASLEVLQAKLNTIIEQAESDSMSGSESKENDDVKVTVTADVQIQESVPQQSTEVQVTPNVVSTGIQITDTEMKTASTQTDRQPKKLCLDTNCVVTIPASIPKLCKIEKLSVQHMPPIDIKRKLVVQRVLKFYIDSQGRTHYISQSKARNSKFYELVHTSPQSNLKIRFEKELRDWLKSASSELSFFLTNKHSVTLPYTKPPSAGRLGSVSDGELVIIRKKQLKEGMEPKTADKLESVSKELILKSFHIYDNPNMHDPGETKLPLNVNSIDTSVYKTYINPDGLPNAASTSINRTGIIITPETLQKISQHKPVYIKNQTSFGETKKSIGSKKNQSVAISATEKTQSDPSCSPNNVPINLYDLGLYSAKSTQVETSSFKSSVSSTPEKPKIETENVDPPKTSTSTYDKDTNMSYEKISITVSYSSEETVNSESLASEDFEQRKVSDYVQKHERELHIVEPTQQTTAPETTTTSRLGSQDTFQQLKEKFAKEGYNQKDKVCDIPSVQSLESTIPEFIMSLTESTSHDLKKILPHIRKNVTGSVHSKSNMAYSETGSSRKLYTDNHESGYKNSSSKAKQSKHDFTVLSMQIHGDCVPNDSNLMNSHLKLGKNGRYKDEENLFCENRPKVASLPLRRRMVKNTPRSNYVNKYAFDSSSGDALSVEPSFSEGEIKCHSSASIGEVHRKPQSDHFSKFRPKITHNNSSSDANVIRERRTYFNHWITYYINKNARIPLLSQSSSTSSN